MVLLACLAYKMMSRTSAQLNNYEWFTCKFPAYPNEHFRIFWSPGGFVCQNSILFKEHGMIAITYEDSVWSLTT